MVTRGLAVHLLANDEESSRDPSPDGGEEPWNAEESRKPLPES